MAAAPSPLTVSEITNTEVESNKSLVGEDFVEAEGMKINSRLRTWAELSKINYLSSDNLLKNALSSKMRSIIGFPKDEHFVPIIVKEINESNMVAETFPVNVSTLMNENNYWGSFYVFPELYKCEYSPTVHIHNINEALPIVDGVLTRNLVSTCLSYPKRIPILGDFVYIKLDLSMLYLTNIAVLQHYKYIVYLDLSNNYLTNLNVLSYLLYIQYLSVSFNKLESLLDYEPPQWFLTEVHYKFNSLREIRDISLFWSITILDLSNNYIKEINGLQNLRYLRTLDLSFNQIERLENLNHLPLVWLDLSYNNISTFETGPDVGLYTLLHLEYLNLNENNISTLKIFSGCCRMRELHMRNNELESLVELAVYMRKMRRLTFVDLRANPIIHQPGFREAAINTFPLLLNLNSAELSPVEQRSKKMKMNPDVFAFATRRLQKLLYVEQMKRARVSACIPPADTREVPLVVLVGPAAIGKYTLASRLAEECGDHVRLAILHTTAKYEGSAHYIQVSVEKFDDMILNGEFLTYTEKYGDSYGLSREQALIKDGKVTVVCMDLVSALMLKLRGRRPYLILICEHDRSALSLRQHRVINARDMAREKWTVSKSIATTVQPIPSGRLIIAGILNELLMMFPESERHINPEFIFSSDCSLMNEAMVSMFDVCLTDMSKTMAAESQITQAPDLEEDRAEETKPRKISYDDHMKMIETSDLASYSLTSYYIDTKPGDRPSDATGDSDRVMRKMEESEIGRCRQQRLSENSGAVPKVLSTIRESVKSVQFVPQDENVMTGEFPGEHPGTTTPLEPGSGVSLTDYSSSAHEIPGQDYSLWQHFLHENGGVSGPEPHHKLDGTVLEKVLDKLENMSETDLLKFIDFYQKIASESVSEHSQLRDEYETVHRNRPGLFWDTIFVDNPRKAFQKLKRIVRDIVRSQDQLEPMFDINFTAQKGYPNVQERLANIKKAIAPRRTF